MPVCCRCNTSGRCKNCSSKKSGKPCSDCLHVRQGHCENDHPLPDAVEPPPLTDWESPNMATTHPSSLPHEEGPEQGSELSNTSLLDDNLHTLPLYPQIHEDGEMLMELPLLMPSHVAIMKWSIGNAICSRFPSVSRKFV